MCFLRPAAKAIASGGRLPSRGCSLANRERGMKTGKKGHGSYPALKTDCSTFIHRRHPTFHPVPGSFRLRETRDAERKKRDHRRMESINQQVVLLARSLRFHEYLCTLASIRHLSGSYSFDNGTSCRLYRNVSSKPYPLNVIFMRP